MYRKPLLLALLAFPALAAAPAPDRSPLPEEWGYHPPEASTLTLNPPSLTWVHERDAATYTLQWSSHADFSAPTTIEQLPWTAYTHNRPLTPGAYVWRYRITSRKGDTSPWSRTRHFTIPASAVEFPKPDLDEMRSRIGPSHPRLFVRPDDRDKLHQWSAAGGRQSWEALQREADRVVAGTPISEPTEMGSAADPKTVQFWWPNRLQTERACMEAEAVAFAFWLTGEQKYGTAARRYALHLASWNPDGPTNWQLNDEAAMPILFRLARVYDWAYDALSADDRIRIQAVMRRRGADAFRYGLGSGAGHLNNPYGSHANRAWHKLGEVAIAGLGDIPEAGTWLRFALDKFWGVYPVWSDDDGGWHEGADYWYGYNTKVTWWLDIMTRYGIDSFKKPYFAHAVDYLLYTAPPGSPDKGLGDLSFSRPSPAMSVVEYYARRTHNPTWAWWAAQWGIKADATEPVLAFLRSADRVAPQAPTALPPSKVFHGTGVAILNTDLIDSARNVQVRFKSSPFGRQSHGHDPNNSFTLNAYGEQLLVNNVYRDLYGSPFHKRWVWETKSQNAMLVNGLGQKVHTADAIGRISHSELSEGLDWVTGDAAESYEGKLRSYQRHVIFVKPDVVLIVDEVEAAGPSTFQFMLHGQGKFEVNGQQLRLDRPKAGVLVDYISPEPLSIRQWDGYDPPPGSGNAANVAREFPNQWHIEAATRTPTAKAFVVAVLRPYRKGQPVTNPIRREPSGLMIPTAGGEIKVAFHTAGNFATVQTPTQTSHLK
jgi:hypothetical protein